MTTTCPRLLPPLLRFPPFLLLLPGLAGLPAAAQTSVYRCTDATGRVAYQERPCNSISSGGAGDGTGNTGNAASPGAAPAQTLLRLPAQPPPAPVPASTPIPAAATPRPPAPATAPRVAAITLYYDTTDEPVEYPTPKMEAFIQAALRAWTAGCQVDLRYGGRAPYRAGGSPERVSLRWLPQYLAARHPADAGFGIAGTGSMAAGISLSTRFGEAAMHSTLVHELGHVLGLPHNHADPKSVMSYLRDEDTRRLAQPSAADFLACNLSMKKLFGIDFEPPSGASGAPGAQALPAGRGMSDREALEQKRRGPGP